MLHDLLRFLNGSLDTLSELLNPKTDFDIICSEFPGMYSKFLRQEGLFCYDYLDSEKKLLSTVGISPIEKFDSTLMDINTNASAYAHAESIWDIPYPKNLMPYTESYLKPATLLLASFFEKFHDIPMENFGLDPAKYVSLPSFLLDTMLLDTSYEIRFITDCEMLFMIKLQIRRGIGQFDCRYVESNHAYMGNFDPRKREYYLAYICRRQMVKPGSWSFAQVDDHPPADGFKIVDFTVCRLI